jgi:hypothetical protein
VLLGFLHPRAACSSIRVADKRKKLVLATAQVFLRQGVRAWHVMLDDWACLSMLNGVLELTKL